MLGWVALGGAAAAHAVNWGTTFSRLARRVPKLTAEAVALGLPTTAEQYAASIAVENDQNAVHEYISLAWYLDELKKTNPDFLKELDRLTVKAGPDPQFGQTYREQLTEIRRRFERASEYPLFRYNRFMDANAGGDNNLVYVLKRSYKAFSLGIEQLAIEQRFDEALDGLGVMRRSIAQGVHEPMLLAWLVDCSCRTYYITTINFLAKRGFVRPGILDDLERALKELPPLTSLRQAFRGEFYNSISRNERELKDKWLRSYPNGLPHPMSMPIFHSSAAFRAMRAQGLQWTLTAIRQLPPTNDDPMAIAKVFEPKWYSGHWWISPTEAFRILKQNLAEPILHYRARLTLAQAGIDVFRIRMATGTYPLQIPSAVQPDRYHSVIYERTTDGFTLRSGNFEY